jgi:predicted dehydrogenase
MIDLQIGIIGLGYWGANLIRNFTATQGCKVSAIADVHELQLQRYKALYPSLETFTDATLLIKHAKIDAVVIATPVFMHYSLAKIALEAGKHVLIEKPMAASSAEATELIELATKKGLTLMVDHTFLYTGAVQKIKALVDSKEIGTIKYIDSTRINLGLFQSDINVLWDLAPHDISIVNYILDAKPIAVNAVGISHTNNAIENIAYLNLFFDTNVIAHFNCSWTSPVKIRKFLIGGDKKMIVWDDMEPTEKVKVYDTGYNHQTDEEKRKVLVDYRTGDIFVPKLQVTEALSLMAKDFIHAITTKKEPLATAQNGLFVVKILEAAQKSIKHKGTEILL